MKCKEAHINFTQLLEESLTAELKAKVQQHIDSCNNCQEALAQLQSAYSLIEEEKKSEVNPFLLTRINQHIDEIIENKKGNVFSYKRILIPAFSTFALIIGMSFGIWFGIATANSQGDNTYAEIEMQSYLNDFQQEYLETAILTEQE